MSNYIVLLDSEPEAIQSPEEFRKTFAPVETPEEALAFAVALTTAYPLYSIEIPDDYVRLETSIEPTNVKKLGNDFLVHLFNYDCHGCGLHPYYSVDYHVSLNGFVTEIKRTDTYRNPKDDYVCAD